MKALLLYVIGVLVSLLLVVVAGIIAAYGLILETIIHPSKSANRLIDACLNLQSWVDKKVKK